MYMYQMTPTLNMDEALSLQIGSALPCELTKHAKNVKKDYIRL